MNEADRLRTLNAYNIMDSAAERVFDDLTELASVICSTPISMVSLVDDKRQWFKSKIGIAATETPREQAFCAHTIQNNRILEVKDAYEDPRFAENPLVIGDPNIRFYAGAPLQTREGARLGTLCVIDTKPRKLTNAQRKALQVLSDTVVAQIEYRRALQDIKKLEKILPMCAWCRSIRVDNKADEKAVWQPLEEYVSEQNQVSHCICPSCQTSMKKSS
ncbi:MAG: GAF domain-containing protein [Gammaproteobacteria bacterium]